MFVDEQRFESKTVVSLPVGLPLFSYYSEGPCCMELRTVSAL